MNQTLYAHMNKRKKILKMEEVIVFISIINKVCSSSSQKKKKKKKKGHNVSHKKEFVLIFN
jgi:hypothetical protein